VRAGRLVLEIKLAEARTFGNWLDAQPATETDMLMSELRRATTFYRIAIHNVLKDQAEKDADGK